MVSPWVRYALLCFVWALCRSSSAPGQGEAATGRQGKHLGRPAGLRDHSVGPSRPRPRFPIRHLCSNPRCCRPDHLAVGTALENAQDTIRAGRYRPRREPLAVRKARALALRGAEGTIEELAARYGISQSAARRAVQGRTWADLPGAREALPNGGHKWKLTEDAVRAIRESDEPNKVLAARYGATAPAINAVRK